MKAISVAAFGGPEVLTIGDVDLPPLRPDEVLVKIAAAGVNPVDTYIRNGAYGNLPLPYTPGKDGAGVIEAVGPNVTRFAKGDRVYVYNSKTGTYAEYAIALEHQVWPLPGHVSFSEGASIGVPYGTAYRALMQKAQAKPGETVLIHGASGGVGIAAVQIASLYGLKVVGTASTDEGRDLVLAAGAAKVYNHKDAGYDQQMATDFPGGFDVILEMLANVNLSKDLELVAKFGRIVIIGNRGPTQIDARMTMAKDCVVTGMALFNASPEQMSEVFSAVTAGLAKGTLKPVVTVELPLSEASEAHRLIMDHTAGARGNIALLLE